MTIRSASEPHSGPHQKRMLHRNARTKRTYGLTKNPQDQGEYLTFLNACEKGGIEMRNDTTRTRCDEHGVYLPCAGCRADELESTGRHVVGERGPEVVSFPDVRRLAAGEREEG